MSSVKSVLRNLVLLSWLFSLGSLNTSVASEKEFQECLMETATNTGEGAAALIETLLRDSEASKNLEQSVNLGVRYARQAAGYVYVKDLTSESDRTDSFGNPSGKLNIQLLVKEGEIDEDALSPTPDLWKKLCASLGGAIPNGGQALCEEHLARRLGAVEEFRTSNADLIEQLALSMEKGGDSWKQQALSAKFASGANETMLRFGSKPILSRADLRGVPVKWRNGSNYIEVEVSGQSKDVVLPSVSGRPGSSINPFFFVSGESIEDFNRLYGFQ